MRVENLNSPPHQFAPSKTDRGRGAKSNKSHRVHELLVGDRCEGEFHGGDYFIAAIFSPADLRWRASVVSSAMMD